MKRKKPTYYTTLEFLPIYNWYKIHTDPEKVDLSWLLFDRVDKVSVDLSVVLRRIYKKMVLEAADIRKPLIRAKARLAAMVVDALIQIVNEAEDLEQLDDASVILRALLIADEPDLNWLVAKNIFRTPESKQTLTFLAVEIKNYQEIKEQAEEGKVEFQSLEEKTVRIESVLGIAIDVHSCSVLKYQAYERQAIEKINYQSKVLQ